jgi:hypothetical protein
MIVGVLYLLENWARISPGENFAAYFLGTVLLLLAAGLTLGIAGLCQRTRRRLWAILGVVGNSLTILLLLAIWALFAILDAMLTP